MTVLPTDPRALFLGLFCSQNRHMLHLHLLPLYYCFYFLFTVHLCSYLPHDQFPVAVSLPPLSFALAAGLSLFPDLTGSDHNSPHCLCAQLCYQAKMLLILIGVKYASNVQFSALTQIHTGLDLKKKKKDSVSWSQTNSIFVRWIWCQYMCYALKRLVGKSSVDIDIHCFQGFTCYSFTWFGADSLWWLILANLLLCKWNYSLCFGALWLFSTFSTVKLHVRISILADCYQWNQSVCCWMKDTVLL